MVADSSSGPESYNHHRDHLGRDPRPLLRLRSVLAHLDGSRVCCGPGRAPPEEGRRVSEDDDGDGPEIAEMFPRAVRRP